MLTRALLDRLWPNGDSKVPGLRDGIITASAVVFPKYGLTTPQLVAHAMAQFSHECGGGTEMVENLNYSADGLMKTWPGRFNEARAAVFAHNPRDIAKAVYNNRMGNLPGSDDGWNFRGRGLSQCTGREGYQRLGAAAGLDLVGNPDTVNDPRYALECGVADFVMCGCLPPARQDDVREVTHRLNGGYIGLAERKAWLDKWKSAIGHEASLPSPPDVPPVEPKPTGAGPIIASLLTLLWPKKGT